MSLLKFQKNEVLKDKSSNKKLNRIEKERRRGKKKSQRNLRRIKESLIKIKIERSYLKLRMIIRRKMIGRIPIVESNSKNLKLNLKRSLQENYLV